VRVRKLIPVLTEQTQQKSLPKVLQNNQSFAYQQSIYNIIYVYHTCRIIYTLKFIKVCLHAKEICSKTLRSLRNWLEHFQTELGCLAKNLQDKEPSCITKIRFFAQHKTLYHNSSYICHTFYSYIHTVYITTITKTTTWSILIRTSSNEQLKLRAIFRVFSCEKNQEEEKKKRGESVAQPSIFRAIWCRMLLSNSHGSVSLVGRVVY
jgi:hypothetical protein